MILEASSLINLVRGAFYISIDIDFMELNFIKSTIINIKFNIKFYKFMVDMGKKKKKILYKELETKGWLIDLKNNSYVGGIKGLQRAGPGRPTRRNEALGPSRARPLGV